MVQETKVDFLKELSPSGELGDETFESTRDGSLRTDVRSDVSISDEERLAVQSGKVNVFGRRRRSGGRESVVVSPEELAAERMAIEEKQRRETQARIRRERARVIRSPVEREAERIQLSELKAAQRSERTSEIFRVVPGLKGENFIQRTGRETLALPARAVFGGAEQVTIGIRKIGLGIKAVGVGGGREVATEFGDAFKRVPVALGKTFDPRTPSGVANIIGVAGATFIGGASIARGRGLSVDPGTLKVKGARVFTNEKLGTTTVVEKGTFISKSGLPRVFDVRTVFEESGVGKSITRIKTPSGKLLKTSKSFVRQEVFNVPKGYQTVYTKVGGVFGRATKIKSVEQLIQSEPLRVGETVNVKEFRFSDQIFSGKGGRLVQRVSSKDLVKSQGKVSDNVFKPSNIVSDTVRSVTRVKPSIRVRTARGLKKGFESFGSQPPQIFSEVVPGSVAISRFASGFKSGFDAGSFGLPETLVKPRTTSFTFSSPSRSGVGLASISRATPTSLVVPLASVNTNSLVNSGVISRGLARSDFNVEPVAQPEVLSEPVSVSTPISSSLNDVAVNEGFESFTDLGFDFVRSVPRTSGLRVGVRPPLLVGFPGFVGLDGGRVGGVGRSRQVVGYNPSVFASVFGIKGKRSRLGELTGLGVRPIQNGRR